jgi:hypothetical protein
MWLLSRTPKRTHKKKFWGLVFFKTSFDDIYEYHANHPPFN